MNEFHKIPKPVTEYQANLQNINRDVIDLWLESFAYNHMNGNDIIEKRPHECLSDFKEYCRQNGFDKCAITSQSLVS